MNNNPFETAHDPAPETELSPSGTARRATMKTELAGSFVSHHRTRRNRRVAVHAIAAVVIVAIAVPVIHTPAPTLLPPDLEHHALENPALENPALEHHTIHPAPSPTTPPSFRIVRTATDPGILARFAPTPRPKIQLIDDDALLTTLAHYGHQTGLIRRGDVVTLTRDLTLTQDRLQ